MCLFFKAKIKLVVVSSENNSKNEMQKNEIRILLRY